jgi:peptidoglycan/LPS O-acetylase OafA/YrhL
LLIPPMAWIASKYRGLRVFFIASAAGILWQSLGGYFREKNGFDSNYEFSSFFFVLTTIPAFAIGIFARNLQRAFQIFTILKVVCLIIVTFDIVGGVVKTIFDVETRYTIFNNYMRGSASFFVYGIVFLMLIIRVESWNFKNQIFSTCAQIGEMSYSIYLIHVPILLFFAEHVSESLASAFFALIVILFASKVSYAIFEKPFMQISKKEILRY